MSATLPKFKLDSGTHSRVDRGRMIEMVERGVDQVSPRERHRAIKDAGAVTTLKRGEAFVPTDDEKRKNQDRLSRTTKYFTVPRVPWLESKE